MARFHISPRTGNPMVCKAKGKCPFGDLDKDHFDTRELAQAAYEQRMKQVELPSFEPGKIRVTALPAGVKQDGNTFVVPKGVYVLGDPGFTAGRDSKAWREWQQLADASRDKAVGANYNGYPVLAFKTPGNGFYYDNMGRGFISDSGYMGLIPVSLAKQMGMDDMEAFDDGHLLNFKDTARVTLENGTYFFGDKIFMQAEPESGEDEFSVDDTFEENAELPDEAYYEDDEWRHVQDEDFDLSGISPEER